MIWELTFKSWIRKIPSWGTSRRVLNRCESSWTAQWWSCQPLRRSAWCRRRPSLSGQKSSSKRISELQKLRSTWPKKNCSLKQHNLNVIWSQKRQINWRKTYSLSNYNSANVKNKSRDFRHNSTNTRRLGAIESLAQPRKKISLDRRMMNWWISWRKSKSST